MGFLSKYTVCYEKNGPQKIESILHNKQETRCLLWSTYFYQLVYVLLKIFTKEKVLLTSDLIFENFINNVIQGWRLKFTTFYFTLRLYPNNVYSSNKITSKNERLSLFHCKQSQKAKRHERFRAWQENFCLIKSFICNIPKNKPWEKKILSCNKPTVLCKNITNSTDGYYVKHLQYSEICICIINWE